MDENDSDAGQNEETPLVRSQADGAEPPEEAFPEQTDARRALFSVAPGFLIGYF